MEATKDLVYKSLVDTLKAALPNFGYCTYKLLISLVTGKKIELTTEKMLKFFNRMREVVYFDLINGGSICNALDSIELFKNIPSDLKFEIFQSSFGASFGVVEMCVRSYMKANSDKGIFIEQRKACGVPSYLIDLIRNQFLLAGVNENDVPAVKGFGHHIMFPSPWAQSREDEEFFSNTLDTLGNIVKDDVKLGTIYTLLVLATPGDEVSER